MYKSFLKRMIDLLLSMIGLILLSPAFLIVSLWIKLDSGGPVFFKQRRIGKNKREFYILKFRTMRVDTPHDVPTHLLESADQYITRIGHFLRKWSIDEFPQLINILKGEMSLIGPRPALWNQFDLIAERDKYGANNVTPGLTGWAQINGRDELPSRVKAKLDGIYVEKMSFWFEFKIFYLTIFRVLKRDGVKEGENIIKQTPSQQQMAVRHRKTL
jgi:O-antigen biosynthesis protein WbqP